MKEATIHIVDGKADDIHFDGQEGMSIDAFLLITHRSTVERDISLLSVPAKRWANALQLLSQLPPEQLWELGKPWSGGQDILDVARRPAAVRGRWRWRRWTDPLTRDTGKQEIPGKRGVMPACQIRTRVQSSNEAPGVEP